MIKLFTIGFTKKSAKQFFELLKKNGVKKIIDIRINNSSQLAGFAKGSDLEYFAKEIVNIDYLHLTDFAPSKELFTGYKDKKVDWANFQKIFRELLAERGVEKKYAISEFDNACFLCSEDDATQCHRRLVVEYLKEKNPGVQVVHLK